MIPKVSAGSFTKLLFPTLLLLSPVVFLPMTRDFFDPNKWMVFVFTTLMALLLWTIYLLRDRASISVSPVTLGMSALAASSWITLALIPANKLQSAVSLFGPITWTAATVILLIGPGIVTPRIRTLLRLGLGLLGGIAGLLIIYQQLGIASVFFAPESVFADSAFTPLGSLMSLTLFLFLSLPIVAGIAINSIREKNEVLAAVSVVMLVLSLGGLYIVLYRMLPLLDSQLLPLPLGVRMVQASWDSILHLLVGTGADGFFELFTKNRPQSLNIGPIWNTGFSTNSSLFLHTANAMGIVGIASLLFFLVALVLDWWRYPISRIQAILLIVMIVLAPANLVTLITAIILILTTEPASSRRIHLPPLGRWATAIICWAIVGVCTYGLVRWFNGERLIAQSIRAAQENNGSGAFMLQEQAVKANPMNPLYRRTLGQTAVLLSQSLVAGAPTDEQGKPQIPQEDQTLISSLVGRGIQEAKQGVTLAPNSVHSWIGLAQVYQGLIGIAKDADTWAIAAYRKAMQLDPTNPVLRLDLGGLFMSVGKYEEAAREFIAAVTLKPNYVDGYYNMANAFAQSGNWDQAVIALEQTKLLVAKGSTDEGTIDQEIITILNKKKEKGPPQTPTTLIVPRLEIPQ